MKLRYNFLRQRYFIVLVLLGFMLFGFSFAKADSSIDTETSLQLDNSELAIWNIFNIGMNNGTGFFVGENLFVTNFHVISYMLNGSRSLADIILLQEGGDFVVTIKKVIAVSALHDLALLETEDSVANYLHLRESSPEPGEDLFLRAYPYGVFTEIRKTGDIFFENDLYYTFPTNNSSMAGASGAPILDDQGQVVGVVFLSAHDLLQATKINHLQELIKGNGGIRCAKSVSVVEQFFNKECIKKEIERLKQLAEEGSMYAQYRLADKYEYGDEGIGLDIMRPSNGIKKQHSRVMLRPKGL